MDARASVGGADARSFWSELDGRASLPRWVSLRSRDTHVGQRPTVKTANLLVQERRPNFCVEQMAHYHDSTVNCSMMLEVCGDDSARNVLSNWLCRILYWSFALLCFQVLCFKLISLLLEWMGCFLGLFEMFLFEAGFLCFYFILLSAVFWKIIPLAIFYLLFPKCLKTLSSPFFLLELFRLISLFFVVTEFLICFVLFHLQRTSLGLLFVSVHLIARFLFSLNWYQICSMSILTQRTK